MHSDQFEIFTTYWVNYCIGDNRKIGATILTFSSTKVFEQVLSETPVTINISTLLHLRPHCLTEVGLGALLSRLP